MKSSATALDRLASQNPVAASGESREFPADQDLGRILSQPQDISHPGGRRTLLVAAAALIVLLVGIIGIAVSRHGGIVEGGSERSTFALPHASAVPFEVAPLDRFAGKPLQFMTFDRPVGADELLDLLAYAAGRQPAVPGFGQYEYLKTREWSFFTRQTQDGEVFDQGTAESVREDWRGPDGAGRMETMQDGKLESADVPPQPLFPGIDTSPQDSVDVVRQRIIDRGRSWTALQWFDAYGQEWGTRILSPLVQEAYLQALAQQSGPEVLGEVVDRAGRSGVAVSAASDDLRLVLIFDPNSGALLDLERIALSEQAVEVPVPVPSTIGYTVFLDRGRAPTVEARP